MDKFVICERAVEKGEFYQKISWNNLRPFYADEAKNRNLSCGLEL